MSDTGVARIEPQPIPQEIKRWNWGAFLLSWIWGVGNNTYIALLALIPGVGVIMRFVLGAKGSVWAWRNGRWDSVEHFKRVQRRWAMWGAIIWVAMFVLFGAVFGGLFFSLTHSGAYTLGVAKLRESPIAASVLGTPIATGFPFGAISVKGVSGKASLSFSATGPKAAGRVFLQAIKKDGVWSLRTLKLKVKDSDSIIDIVGGNTT